MTTAKQKRLEDLGIWTLKAGKPSGIVKAEVLTLPQICERIETLETKRERLRLLRISVNLFL